MIPRLEQSRAAIARNVGKNIMRWSDLLAEANLFKSRVRDDTAQALWMMKHAAVKDNNQYTEALGVFAQNATKLSLRCEAAMKDIPVSGTVPQSQAGLYVMTGATIHGIINEYMQVAHPQITMVLSFLESLPNQKG